MTGIATVRTDPRSTREAPAARAPRGRRWSRNTVETRVLGVLR